MKLLKTGKNTRTSEVIAAEIDVLDVEAATRASELAELQSRRPSLVVEGDVDEIERIDAAIRRARIKGEVDAAKRDRLVEERATAVETEREADRCALYAQGQRAAKAAAKLRSGDYVEAARRIASILSEVEEHRRTIASANADLPANAEPIRDPEEDLWLPAVETTRSTGQRRGAKENAHGVLESIWVPYEVVNHGRGPIPQPPLAQIVILPGTSIGAPPFWPQASE